MDEVLQFTRMLLCILFKIFLSQAVAEMAAIGFGLPKDAFTSLMKQVWSFLSMTRSISNLLLSFRSPSRRYSLIIKHLYFILDKWNLFTL